MKVIWIIYELIIIILGGLIAFIWYKNRHTFPLMERSPYLSIYFLFNVIIYLLSYPIFLQSEYLQQNESSLLLKCLFIPFQASYTYIYLIKSCRLSWGFNIQRKGCLKKYESKLNQFFGNESYVVLFCFFILIFQICTGIIPSQEYNQFDYMSINIENNDIYILLARMIENFIGLVFLFTSIYLVKKVDSRVSIIYELYVIIICDFATSYFRHLLMITTLGENNFCFQSIPLLYLTNFIKLTVTVIVGMVRPINMINREHEYYNSVLIRQIGFFIFYRKDLFNKFIQHCQQQQQLKLQQQIVLIQHNLLSPSQNNVSREQGLSHSPIFQSSQYDSQAQNDINIPPLNLQQQQQSSPSQVNLSQDDQQNLHQNSSQQSSSFSNTLFGNRDAFYKIFNFEFVQGHYKIYSKSIKLRSKLSQEDFEVQFKCYFEKLKSKGQVEKYFSKQNELIVQINYWLNSDSFKLSINRNEDQADNLLSSSCIGVVGTLYQNNQQQNQESENDNFVERKQLENSQIIENILSYSEEQLKPCFNEYKMTQSFHTIQQSFQNLQKAYTNLLQVNMAVDQHITVD